jgi:hypothetical protein
MALDDYCLNDEDNDDNGDDHNTMGVQASGNSDFSILSSYHITKTMDNTIIFAIEIV